MADELVEPIKPEEAKRLILQILKSGTVTYSCHAKEEILADNMTTLDCEYVLRGGFVRPGEYENGSWRYKVETDRMAVVICFRSKTQLVLVTAWRKKK